MEDKKTKKFNLNILYILIAAIICGFISAMIGLFLLTSGSIPFLSDYSVSSRDADKQIVIDQPRNVIVQQDIQLQQLENNVLPALVNIYPDKKPATGFAQNQILGQGMVLTSDGWVMFPDKALADPAEKYLAIGYQNKEYELSNFVQDKATGLWFGRMQGAKGLPVAAIGRSRDASLGQSVAVLNGRDAIETAGIIKIGYDFSTDKNIIQSSESFGKQIFLDLTLDNSHNGAIVANLKGEVIGMASGGKVIMSDYFNRTIADVLSAKKISRPQLGISYVDLAETEGVIKYGDKGAYVTDVAKSGPAYGKLKAGDVIKKVNDYELNSSISLSEAINNFYSGNKIELTYSRAGKDATVDIILK